MKNRFKKVGALVLALAMILSSFLFVFADAHQSSKLNLDNAGISSFSIKFGDDFVHFSKQGNHYESANGEVIPEGTNGTFDVYDASGDAKIGTITLEADSNGNDNDNESSSKDIYKATAFRLNYLTVTFSWSIEDGSAFPAGFPDEPDDDTVAYGGTYDIDSNADAGKYVDGYTINLGNTKYTFGGWSTKDSVKDVTSDINFAGVWKTETLQVTPTTYKVTYEYDDGPAPLNPDTPPAAALFAEGDAVALFSPTSPVSENNGTYTFNGWTTADANIVNGGFTMPGNDVRLIGSWTWTPDTTPTPTPTDYTVSYEYTGTVPAGAPDVPVSAKETENYRVQVAAAPTLTGYTFSGWTTGDADVVDGVFVMPSKDVKFTGSWTEVIAPPPGPVGKLTSVAVVHIYSCINADGSITDDGYEIECIPPYMTLLVGSKFTAKPKTSHIPGEEVIFDADPGIYFNGGAEHEPGTDIESDAEIIALDEAEGETYPGDDVDTEIIPGEEETAVYSYSIDTPLEKLTITLKDWPEEEKPDVENGASSGNSRANTSKYAAYTSDFPNVIYIEYSRQDNTQIKPTPTPTPGPSPKPTPTPTPQPTEEIEEIDPPLSAAPEEVAEPEVPMAALPATGIDWATPLAMAFSGLGSALSGAFILRKKEEE